MNNEIETIKVVFRTFKEDGSVIALFPEVEWDKQGNCSSYMRIGQHGAANYNSVISITRPSGPEFKSLAKELESIGYNLVIRAKYIRSRK
jgi:hypothetical protein